MSKSANDWKVLILVFAGLIFVVGAISLGVNIHQYGTAQWPSIVQGVCYLIVGAIGVYSAVKHDYQMAKMYLIGLGVTCGIAIILLIINFVLIGNVVDTVCRDNTTTSDDYENCKTAVHSALLIAQIISGILIVACCSCCMFCAYSYQKALHDEHDHHHHHGHPYEQVPSYQHA